MNSQWELNPQVKGLYAVQTFQSRIERDSLVLNAPPRGYGLRCRTWEIEVVAGSESHAQHLCFLLRERYNAMVLFPSVMPHWNFARKVGIGPTDLSPLRGGATRLNFHHSRYSSSPDTLFTLVNLLVKGLTHRHFHEARWSWTTLNLFLPSCLFTGIEPNLCCQIEQGTIWMTSPKDSWLRTRRFNN